MFSVMKLCLNQLDCGVKVWRSFRRRDLESLSSLRVEYHDGLRHVTGIGTRI